MNDLIDQAKVIRQNYESFIAAASQITSPENIARQERLEHLRRLIKNEMKFAREDTLGDIDDGPITRFFTEKADLEKEIERDIKHFAQQFQDASDRLASTSQRIRSRSALSSSAPALGHGRGQTGSILTPTRSSPSRQSNSRRLDSDGQVPGTTQSLVSHDDNGADDEFNPEHDTDNWHQPLPTGSEDQCSTTAQAHRTRPRRTVSTVSSIENRPAKRSRLNERQDEATERNNMADIARPPATNNNLATPSPDIQPTQASSAPGANKRKTRRRKAKSYQWKPPTRFSDLDRRIVDLSPGDIVAVRWGKPNIFQPAMILPWGTFERFDYTTTLQNVSLNGEIPKCYDGAQEGDLVPRPWAPGFEDNGRLAHKRSLPVLFFKKLEDFPINCKSSWVQLNKLKVFDKDCPYTINKGSVKEYLECYAECRQELAARAARLAAENESDEDEEFDSDLPGENQQDESLKTERITQASSAEVSSTGSIRPQDLPSCARRVP
ncbi:hypothetical protein FSARC_2807 [Fusarium sarcochroum]|uniref:Uncharacterized protein n=1 Tax=Fusarium sarcochroum TaxID=1208366 RepID=A0A8H4U5C6_9HYPO|nr:hypothetical protein FSARC_2807 [Fusarium sarcochroum]